MDNQTKEMQRLMSQIMDSSMIFAGVSCAVYCLIVQRVPLVLAFVPVGEITPARQPTAYWGFIVTSISLAIVGVAQLVRSRS